jgi:hypothetical protein
MGAAALAVALMAAPSHPALLPSPTTPLDTRVPLTAAATPIATRLPLNSRVANRQEVLVDVTPDGTVVRVRVRQRLTLRGLGDYFFQLPAPVLDVRALPESQSEPGLRRNAILWQGFSPGRRLLAAEIELDPKAAAPVLPLKLERRPGGILLRNSTSARGVGFVARTQRSEMLAVLRAIRREAARGTAATQPSVQVEGATTGRRILVDAPLRIDARIGSAGRGFGVVLGGRSPRSTLIRVRPGSNVELVARPLAHVDDLTRPPRGATGTELLLLAERALLRLARVHQYESFLAGPGTGAVETVYRYRMVAATAPGATPDDEGEDGGALLVILLVGGAIVGLAGAVVLWAHL